MSVTIEISTDLEETIRQRAVKAGQNLSTFVLEAVREKIARSQSLDEICAPFAHAVSASGITDDGFDELVEEARQEVWQAKRVQGS